MDQGECRRIRRFGNDLGNVIDTGRRITVVGIDAVPPGERVCTIPASGGIAGIQFVVEIRAYIDTDVMFGGGVQTQTIDQSARVSVPAPDDIAGPGLFA